MRTTRSTTRRNPVTALLAGLATLLGIVVLGTLGPTAAHAQSPSDVATGLHISDGRLLEGNGNDFIMRGVNHAHTWYPGETQSLADIKALGANTVRVVLSDGYRWTKNSPAEVAGIVAQCKANRLICVLEVHDTTGYGEDSAAGTLDQAADYWIGLKDVLAGEENYVIINIGNEPRATPTPKAGPRPRSPPSRNCATPGSSTRSWWMRPTGARTGKGSCVPTPSPSMTPTPPAT